MLARLICDVGIAALAMFGFCCMIHILLDSFFSAKHFWITVKIRDEKDADMLDMLLHEAESAFFRKKATHTVVLISSVLFENETVGSPDGVLYDRYADLIEAYAAECYIMDWD